MPPNWYVAEKDNAYLVKKDHATYLRELDKSYGMMSSLAASSLHKLDEVVEDQTSKRNKWGFRGFRLDMAISTTGLLGLFVGGGTSAFGFFWRPKKSSYQLSSEGTPIIELRPSMSNQKVQQAFEPFIHVLIRSGKVKAEYEKNLRKNLAKVTAPFQKLLKALAPMDHPGHWWVSGLRLDLSIRGDGTVYKGIRAGVSSRLRLEWHRQERLHTTGGVPFPKDKLKDSLRKLIGNLAYDLDTVVRSRKWPFFYPGRFRIALGLSAEGEVELVKLRGEVAGSINFNFDPFAKISSSNQHNLSQEVPYSFRTKDKKGKIYQAKLSRKVFRKSLNRLCDVGEFFFNRTSKSDKNAKHRAIEFFRMSIQLSLSLSTGVGAATLKGWALGEMNFFKRPAL